MFELDWDYWQSQFLLAAIAVLIFTGAVVVFLVVTLVRKHRQVNRPDTPLPVKFSYYASIIYAIFPVDLLPDPLLIDDIGVLLGALLYVSHGLKKLRPRPAAGGHQAPIPGQLTQPPRRLPDRRTDGT